MGDDQSVQEMAETFGGESARNNFALASFEQALEWGLGIAAMNFLLQTARLKRVPKTFTVAASRSGTVFILVGDRVVSYR